MSKTFLKNVGLSTVSQLISLVFGIATSVVLARCLGAENRGMLAIVILLPTFIHALLASGVGATIVHSVASSEWQNNEILSRVYGIAFYTSLIMGLGAAVAIYFREAIFAGAPLGLLLISLSLLPLNLLASCFSAILQGCSDFISQLKLRILFALSNLSLAIVLVWLLDFGVEGALIGVITVSFSSVIYGLYLVKKKLELPNFFYKPEFQLSKHKKDLFYGGKSHIANMATFLSYKVDQLILNSLLGNKAGLGLYVVAVSNAEKLWLLVNNVSSVIFPFVAENKEDKQGMTLFTVRVASLMFMLLLFGGLVGMALAKPLVLLLYGIEFEAVASIIYWLIPGVIALGHAKIISNYLAGLGRVGINAIGAIGGLIINVTSNFILIPKYGVEGAAMATSLSYICCSIFVACVFMLESKIPFYKMFIPSKNDFSMLKARLGLLVSKVVKLKIKS